MSASKLTAVFIPAAQSAGFRSLRRDQMFWIEIMTVLGDAVSGPQPPYGTFAWRFDEDEYFQPENNVRRRRLPSCLRPARGARRCSQLGAAPLLRPGLRRTPSHPRAHFPSLALLPPPPPPRRSATS
jgi:hypothetical protein